MKKALYITYNAAEGIGFLKCSSALNSNMKKTPLFR